MKLVIAIFLAASLSGCVHIEYSDGYGKKFTYTGPAWGTKHFREFNAQTGVMKGYGSDAQDSLETVVGAAVRAAVGK